MSAALLAAADSTVAAADSGAALIAFWVLAPLAVAGGLGMVFAKSAVHSALWLVLTMLCLGCLYIVQDAEFLGFVQIIVYTGAIMMLFLFVLMLTGRDSGDSVFEPLRGHKIISAVLGVGFVVLLTAGLLRSLQLAGAVGLQGALAERGAVGAIAETLFTDYLFPFELTSALLITAATGAMVLTHLEHRPGEKKNQRQRVAERMRSGRMSPLPGPGVFATSSSNATPALLPDGSIAPGSVSRLVDSAESERVAAAWAAGRTVAGVQAVDHPQALARPELTAGPAAEPPPSDSPDDVGGFGGLAGLAGPGSNEQARR
ncbi:NADH-quinone oxidoreductase subunit J [Nakamurella flava]|uniref:NADH-quinone oxidoreductase subunit J n=1 Tax=Nakamurella flava TaxID=2576308 RepID=A0A4U6QF26_9ACTN|nr:NADH-quinone oxidoreductase subunit J [Nakamurella flava]TKV58606.1 NADH-quinone oxidoreductase subunit J [Nakamurella flava]